MDTIMRRLMISGVLKSDVIRQHLGGSPEYKYCYQSFLVNFAQQATVSAFSRRNCDSTVLTDLRHLYVRKMY